MSRRKIHIFISYKHLEKRYQDHLKAKLKLAGYEVRHDTDKKRDDLHKHISENIDWSDIVVPIITNEWLLSHECRDELVRADERRKQIVPFSKNDIDVDKLPFYLRETIRIKWDDNNIDEKIDELIDDLKTDIIERWKQECLTSVRSIKSEVIKANDISVWKSALLEQILKNASAQSRSIVSENRSSFIVSSENAYLNYADPFFSHADKIIAVCIASISTFWTAPDFQKNVRTYLEHQKKSAKSIRRLFIFETADQANYYKNILQAHHDSYGKNLKLSGVFLCSTDNYLKLLKSVKGKIEVNDLHEDFGLLTFSGSNKNVRAELNQYEFKYREYDFNDIRESTNVLITECFEKLTELNFGEHDSKTGVSRWSPSWWEQPNCLSEGLKVLFANRGGSIRHFVKLKPEQECKNSFPQYLYELEERFFKNKDALKIISVNVDCRHDVLAMDSRFNTKLKVSNDYEYILRLEFENKESLQYYYSQEFHSFERENLYCALSNKVKNDFEALHKLSTQDEKDKAFRAIENYVVNEGLIMRFDVRDDEPFSCVVKKPGISFFDLNR